MAKESTVAREARVNPINALSGESERIRRFSGIQLSDNAKELKYGSREWNRVTNEHAFRSHRTEDGKSYFVSYDGKYFYEKKRR